DSTVIRLDIHTTPPVQVKDEATLFAVVRGAFGQRRKTILNTLSSAFRCDKERMRAVLADAEVPEGARAEALTLSDFARIADRIFVGI
ncbi:MAG: rRNA adenine N-6-methyltransferase family protein, partial [Angelakisella sp.]